MGFRRFSILIGLRTALIMLSLLALTYLLQTPGYHAATVGLACIIIFQCYSVVKFTARTNAELVRFLDAAKHADYSQRFELSDLGAGFAELGEAFEEILARFHSTRKQQEEKLRHLKAVIEHVPVPLISVKQDGKIRLWNNASRRLFGTGNIARASDLEQFGDEFFHHITHMKAGERRLVRFTVDDMAYQLSVSMTDLVISYEHEKLYSLQDIQNELDASQMQAWQDLVKVLTHEIMNSITPIASLSRTANDLIQDIHQQVDDSSTLKADLDDVSHAVTTVARRSEGLMSFVSSYRKLTSLAEPKKTSIEIKPLFLQAIDIIKESSLSDNIDIEISTEPEDLCVQADRAMLEQIVINLLKNAYQATENQKQPIILLRANLNRRGHARIEVIDNGPGIEENAQSKIFIPFFTTKKEGSGVGLALTRQIMNAHGGSVKVSKSELGGAHFSLVF